VRLANYHAYLEKFDPDLTNASRSKDTNQIFRIFKEQLLLVFMLFRRYVIETNKTFTEDDTLLLQGMYMSYTVEDYLRMSME